LNVFVIQKANRQSWVSKNMLSINDQLCDHLIRLSFNHCLRFILHKEYASYLWQSSLASGLVSGNQVNRPGLHMQRLQTVNAIISYLLIFIRQSKKLVVARR
jgi:hypothetical protein